MRSVLFWYITQRRVVILCRRFGTTYRPHLRGSRSARRMEPTGCPETSVANYHSTLRNISEERRFNLHRGGRLQSRVVKLRILLT